MIGFEALKSQRLRRTAELSCRGEVDLLLKLSSYSGSDGAVDFPPMS